ncbi:MAG: AmmeMemoRadiSam system protein B [Acidobacteria bacterium]|nr:MAG: AmmeMemoRadiSam system protein B [Acidobacteriota bacterium]
MLRLPAVAGRFYPGDPAELARQIAVLAGSPEEASRPAIACLVPHAGYRYSGHVAGAVYARLRLPRRFLLLGPRHFSRGKAQAVLSNGAWQTPLGRAEIDSELARELKAAYPQLCEDAVAHQAEHALEVQLPFLQYLSGDFRFVPIALGPTDYVQLESLGHAIAEVLRQQSDSVLMIASSDMNHYESDEITRRKDRAALERVLELDAHGLFDTVRREGISMCGFGPVVSVLTAARLLGAARATLVRYATSGDITGDLREVVGYAGVIVE